MLNRLPSGYPGTDTPLRVRASPHSLRLHRPARLQTSPESQRCVRQGDISALSPRCLRRWAGQIEFERNEMMKLARKQGMNKVEAQLWVYSELDR